MVHENLNELLRDLRIRADRAYAPGTAARALGVEPDDLIDWLDTGQLDLGMFELPSGERRIPGGRILAAVNGGLEGGGPP